MNAGGKSGAGARRWRLPGGGWSIRRQLARGHASRHNLGKIHEAPTATFELKWYAPKQLASDGTMRGDPVRSERLDIEGQRFRKAGLGKDVTDKFSPACPACRRAATA